MGWIHANDGSDPLADQHHADLLARAQYFDSGKRYYSEHQKYSLSLMGFSWMDYVSPEEVEKGIIVHSYNPYCEPYMFPYGALKVRGVTPQAFADSLHEHFRQKIVLEFVLDGNVFVATAESLERIEQVIAKIGVPRP